MNSDKLRNVISSIKRSCYEENEIKLVYFLNNNSFHIYNEYVRLNLYSNFSLTNFKKILSLIKNDYEMKKSTEDKLMIIEIYL